MQFPDIDDVVRAIRDDDFVDLQRVHDLVDQSLPLFHGRRTPDIGLGPLGFLSNLSGCVSAC